MEKTELSVTSGIVWIQKFIYKHDTRHDGSFKWHC